MSAFARLALLSSPAAPQHLPVRDGDPYLEDLAMSAIAALPAANTPVALRKDVPSARPSPMRAPETPALLGMLDRAKAAVWL